MLAFVEVFEIHNLLSAIYMNWDTNHAPSSCKLLSFMVSFINDFLLFKFRCEHSMAFRAKETHDIESEDKLHFEALSFISKISK